MKTNTNDYRGYRFPRAIISHSVWLYHRFSLRFFRKLLKGQGSTPWRLVTDKLKSCGAAYRMTMRGFKSAGQALRFLSVHGIFLNFFRFARHQMRSENYRLLRARSFKEWSAATGA